MCTRFAKHYFSCQTFVSQECALVVIEIATTLAVRILVGREFSPNQFEFVENSLLCCLKYKSEPTTFVLLTPLHCYFPGLVVRPANSGHN